MMICLGKIQIGNVICSKNTKGRDDDDGHDVGKPSEENKNNNYYCYYYDLSFLLFRFIIISSVFFSYVELNKYRYTTNAPYSPPANSNHG